MNPNLWTTNTHHVYPQLPYFLLSFLLSSPLATSLTVCVTHNMPILLEWPETWEHRLVLLCLHSTAILLNISNRSTFMWHFRALLCFVVNTKTNIQICYNNSSCNFFHTFCSKPISTNVLLWYLSVQDQSSSVGLIWQWYHDMCKAVCPCTSINS
jgi:hypothetical protein